MAAATDTPRPEAPTTSQVRHAIDSGQTADKVAFPDPAAAPLGSDDEAAGAPPTAPERAMAHREETKIRWSLWNKHDQEHRREGWVTPVFLAILALMALVVVIGAYSFA
ncbi:hypothetical protein SLNSH_04820 [Alsobacter soli]|uniref:Uncharacterized protein n=1 Tax=Alsobacter soli TaxID=2109933 RepID=A0A2T1HX99_9HYPH|nr:hypothetical protein [Alsobacter soli]PSC06129.1 hypothetical protein SLNSH_04820 [Alsobacter soli]